MNPWSGMVALSLWAIAFELALVVVQLANIAERL